MTKLLMTLLGAGVLAVGGYAASSGLETDPARTASLPGATGTDETTTGTTTGATTAGATTVGDISGPCDEVENRGDARCAGAAPAPALAPAGGTTTAGGDISGPCDEAEHRGDARCTGAPAADDEDDDHSGRGDDDRSGSNSGKG